MNRFEKIFEKLARTDDPNVIFTNWLDYVININLFTVKNHELDFKGHEHEYFNMFAAWVGIQNNYLENNPDKGWYDYLGTFYEDIIQSKFRAGTRGQFFTPSNVCQVMAELTFRCGSEDGYAGKMINDCACGSGRLLLAGKTLAPNGIFIGQDLDPVAVKMAVLNFYIHGVRGAVICKNTLTGEFFEAYRINNYLGYGLPIPHIELVAEKDAYHFIGVKNLNKTKPIELKENIPRKVYSHDDKTIQNKLL